MKNYLCPFLVIILISFYSCQNEVETIDGKYKYVDDQNRELVITIEKTVEGALISYSDPTNNVTSQKLTLFKKDKNSYFGKGYGGSVTVEYDFNGDEVDEYVLKNNSKRTYKRISE